MSSIGWLFAFAFAWVVHHGAARLVGVRGLPYFDPRPPAGVDVPWAKRVAIASAPSLVSYVLAAALLGAGGTGPTLAVVTPVEGGPAARAGVLDGDRVVAVDGAPVTMFADLRPPIVAADAPSQRTLTIERSIAGVPSTVSVVVDVGPERRLGVSSAGVHAPRSAGAAIGGALTAPFAVIATTLRALGALFREDEPVAVGGPVAIVADIRRAPLSIGGQMVASNLVVVTVVALVLLLVTVARGPRRVVANAQTSARGA